MLACLEMIGNGTTCFLEAGTALLARGRRRRRREDRHARTSSPTRSSGTPPTTATATTRWPLDRAAPGLDRALDLMGTELRRQPRPRRARAGPHRRPGHGLGLRRAGAGRQGGGRRGRDGAEPAPVLLPGRRRDRRPPLRAAPTRASGRARRARRQLHLRAHEHPPRRRARAGRAQRHLGRVVPRRLDDVGRRRHDPRPSCRALPPRRQRRPRLGLVELGDALRHRPAGIPRRADGAEKLGDRAALVAEDALAMATINGAKAVGLDDRIGSLEPGKRADIVVRANDVPEAYPLTDPISQLVYSARSTTVHTVVIDGRVVLEAAPSDPRRVAGGLQRRAGVGQAGLRPDGLPLRARPRDGRYCRAGRREGR